MRRTRAFLEILANTGASLNQTRPKHVCEVTQEDLQSLENELQEKIDDLQRELDEKIEGLRDSLADLGL